MVSPFRVLAAHKEINAKQEEIPYYLLTREFVYPSQKSSVLNALYSELFPLGGASNLNVLLFKLFADAYSSEHIALLRLCAGAALSGALLARALLLASSQKPYCAYHIQSENYIFAYTLRLIFHQSANSKSFLF